jgi:uncharacterized C2H2 Zn-finger protein
MKYYQSGDTITCPHCDGVFVIEIIENISKATYPEIEFCPLCGMAYHYEKELNIN